MNKKDYAVTYIMRGLRLQAQGRGDANGNLVADWVKFDEQDLRSAQALEQTNELAEENRTRLEAAEQAAREAKAEAERMADKLRKTRLSLMTPEPGPMRPKPRQMRLSSLRRWPTTGSTDSMTTTRLRLSPVLFKVNSAEIDPAAKEVIDEAATWAVAQRKSGNGNGWMYQVVGYADTIGKTAKNRGLSERRAKAVIRYLVITYNMDLRRLIQPFGYGEEGKPAADNKTAEGRAKNRQVEIIILQNKGIANTVGTN
jgi:outer membrane protein OmpA-like peptidoglycan-associated protein